MLCESNLHQVDANLASSCKVAIEFQDAPSGQSDTMLMNLGSAIGNAYAANSSANQTNSNHPMNLQYADYAESANAFNSSLTSQHNESSHADPSNARISHVQINSQVNDAYPQDQLNANYFDLNFMLPDAQYGLSNGLHPQTNGIQAGDQHEAHQSVQTDPHLHHASPSNQLAVQWHVQYNGDRSGTLDSSGVYPADGKSQLSAVLNSATQLRAAFLPNGQPASSQMSPPASPERLQQLQQQLQRQQQLQLQSNHFTNIIPAHLPIDHRPNGLTSHSNEPSTYDQTISFHQTTNPSSSTLVALLQQKVKTMPPNQCFVPANGGPAANSISTSDRIEPSTRSTGTHQLTNQTAQSNQPLRPNQSNSLPQSAYSRLSSSAPTGSLQQTTTAFLSTAHHKLVTPPSSPNLAELLGAKQTNGLTNGHSLSPMTSMICQPRQTTLMPPSYAASYSHTVVVNLPPNNMQTNSFKNNNTSDKPGDNSSCKAVAKPSKRSKTASKNRAPDKVLLKPNKTQRIKKPNNVTKAKVKNPPSSFPTDSRANGCLTNVALVLSSPATNSDAIAKIFDQNNNSMQSNIENNFLLNNGAEPKQPTTNFADNSDTLSNNSSSLGSNSLETSSLHKPNESTTIMDTKGGKTNNRKKVTQHFCSYSNCKKVYSKSSHLKGRRS